MTDFRNGKVPVFTVWKWCGHTYLLGLGMDLVWTWGSEKKTQVSGIKILDLVREVIIVIPDVTAKRFYFNRRSAEPITASVSSWQPDNNTLSAPKGLNLKTNLL